jgi:hypothetical protein
MHMIRRALYILMFAAGYILLTAKGCEPENNPASKRAANEEVLIRHWEAIFDTASLGLNQQLALTEQGVQKLEDFMDYLDLIGNKNLEDAFRTQAKTTAGRLFQPGHVLVELPVSSSQVADLRSLPSFFTTIERAPTTRISFTLLDAVPEKPLVQVNDTLYMGSVQGRLLVSGVSEKDSATIYDGKVNAEIRAVRTMKKFGNKKTRHVWQVFLGNIQAGD